MIKLVLTDLDDTFVSRRLKGDASEYALDAVKAMLAAGLRFGPVSGRTQGSMARTFHGYAPAYATGAFANGQLVLLDGEVVHREYIAVETLEHVRQILDDTNEGFLTLFEMEGERDPWFVTERNEIPPLDFGFFRRTFGIEHEVREPSLKANIHFTSQGPHLAEVRDMLRAEVPECDFVFPGSQVPLVDIVPRGYGKGTAVKILAEKLGVALEEVATFGDSENDLSMIEGMPNSVAVANAVPEIQAAARWHIGNAEDDAVAGALYEVLEASKTRSMPAFMR